MAKSIKKVQTKKERTVKAIVDGKEMSAKTTRTCVGKLIWPSMKDEKSVCAKCQATGSKVAQICRALTGVPTEFENADKKETVGNENGAKAETKENSNKVQKKKGTVKKGNTAKKVGAKTTRPFNCAIQMWVNGDSKAQVIEMAVEKGMKESAAKRFANDIFSVGMAAVGKARKSGGLIERYLNWAIYGIGEEPTGCKATIGFCKQYAPVFKELELA